MNRKIKDKIWRNSKPASEWVSSYLVIPVLDVIELIEEYEEKDTTHKNCEPKIMEVQRLCTKCYEDDGKVVPIFQDDKIHTHKNCEQKGCGKEFCMDCGIERKGTYGHIEVCTMGDTGFIKCGQEYDEQIMLCDKCKENKQTTTNTNPTSKTTTKEQKGCGRINVEEIDLKCKENAPNHSQQTNHPTAEGVLRKETRKPIAIEDDKTADTIHKNCEQEKAS